ncbi:MAG: DUF6327 family protein [Flavobacteriaceae bacterium]
MKYYNSFEEIEDHLKILSLKRNIEKEQLKLHVNQMKVALYPRNFFRGFDGLFQGIALSLAIRKLLRRQ